MYLNLNNANVKMENYYQELNYILTRINRCIFRTTVNQKL